MTIFPRCHPDASITLSSKHPSILDIEAACPELVEGFQDLWFDLPIGSLTMTGHTERMQ